jgi:TPR repeat protein
MYLHGRSVPQNYKLAMKWYLKAAMQGNAEAEFNIGALYYDGLGTPKDESKAIAWWVKAANQGHVKSKEILERLN